ncbi:LptF/LptG family permease [Devosia aurantiaca]|uniref:LptF/LptG family permease n=1 Tax=Devosia aurantiaca TaxID=2714858 RepID=A0A6M1SUE7_9HYPH|nr:LptF/LptG family permease [Devosia aurantiaca]NGP18972.1 LptF/LptG family permease [Devosia aurantiaca]
MTPIDRLILWRILTRIGVTVFIFFGVIALAESLDTWRFNHVAETRGLPMAIVMVAMSATRWTIKTLPVTVLMGAILGIVDLKMRHELTVIKASGISIWRILRAPVVAIIASGLIIGLGVETLSTQVMRDLAPLPPGQAALLTPPGEIWLEQRGEDAHYVMMARNMSAGGSTLSDLTIFDMTGKGIPRLEAEEATLERGHWLLPSAIARTPNTWPQTLSDVTLPTTSTPAEIRLKLASSDDMTFFELAALLQRGVADPAIRAATTMRLVKLLALPLVLTGSLLIAFAFTAGYNRNTQLGPAALYGITLGFVVFVITEMADRAGTTGVLNPVFAAIGPAIVAIVIGVTVLLHKEDGLT